MAIPTSAEAGVYLAAQGATWDEDAVSAAFDAELLAQRRVCRIPQDTTDPDNPVDDYPDDLTEALFRRVAHNLAVRNIPLGVQTQLSEAASVVTRIGGTDAEVKRLEAPFRRLAVG